MTARFSSLPSELFKTKPEIKKRTIISRKNDFLPKEKSFLYLPTYLT